MTYEAIIDWLLEGDVSIQYQTHRDLLKIEKSSLRASISSIGWGAQYLFNQNKNGHWGKSFYQPKWTSSHYTLLDLKNLCISPEIPKIRATIEMIAQNQKSVDGGINPHTEIPKSDVCINGMFLNYACYFELEEHHLQSVVDFILNETMPDGGFNCRSNRNGAVHSSLHTTISILEGILEYQRNGYTYRLDELLKARDTSIEFILLHQLFISDRTGDIIRSAFLRFPYPSRWKYDILRAMDYFQNAYIAWDERMRPALDVITSKRNKDGRWNINAPYPGKVHFQMEKAGQPSRWNTLRALRVLIRYRENI